LSHLDSKEFCKVSGGLRRAHFFCKAVGVQPAPARSHLQLTRH
jgi:hypothetical protein